MIRLAWFAVLLPALGLAAPQQRVLVASFQSLGVEPEVMTRVGDALRAESTAANWRAIDGAETQRLLRAATMCGEDAECLSTLGQRADAYWVLAWGFGKIGSSYLFTAQLIETPSGRKLAGFTEKLGALPDDARPLAQRAVAALFKDVTRPVILEPPPPPPPTGVTLTERRFVAPTIAATAVAGAAAIAGAIFTGLAASHFSKLSNALSMDRPSLDRTQRSYNLGADVSFAVAIVSGVTALVLFILGAPSEVR
ncbi:MAG: hypothetical protein Q8S33_33430 [Myxococcales bacterium]|nr:hypothetical protein [Myxococcales bacterium]